MASTLKCLLEMTTVPEEPGEDLRPSSWPRTFHLEVTPSPASLRPFPLSTRVP